MKRYLKKLIAIFIISFAAITTTNAQIIIKVRPAAPVVRARPLAPGPRHVWVAGEYAWQGGTYVYTDGYWAVPPARFRVWKEGHWKKRPGGWIWVRGHWVR